MKKLILIALVAMTLSLPTAAHALVNPLYDANSSDPGEDLINPLYEIVAGIVIGA